MKYSVFSAVLIKLNYPKFEQIYKNINNIYGIQWGFIRYIIKMSFHDLYSKTICGK